MSDLICVNPCDAAAAAATAAAEQLTTGNDSAKFGLAVSSLLVSLAAALLS